MTTPWSKKLHLAELIAMFLNMFTNAGTPASTTLSKFLGVNSTTLLANALLSRDPTNVRTEILDFKMNLIFEIPTVLFDVVDIYVG